MPLCQLVPSSRGPSSSISFTRAPISFLRTMRAAFSSSSFSICFRALDLTYRFSACLHERQALLNYLFNLGLGLLGQASRAAPARRSSNFFSSTMAAAAPRNWRFLAIFSSAASSSSSSVSQHAVKTLGHLFDGYVYHLFSRISFVLQLFHTFALLTGLLVAQLAHSSNIVQPCLQLMLLLLLQPRWICAFRPLPLLALHGPCSVASSTRTFLAKVKARRRRRVKYLHARECVVRIEVRKYYT